MAPHLADGQVIFLPPGTFGSVAMMQALRRAGCTADVAFAETGTLPWLTRMHGPAEVAITMRATRLPTGVFPAEKSAAAFAVLRAAFPSVEPIEDALAGALMNAGPIIHPPLILMNAGPLEHFERWDIHNEGTQPSIRRVTNALDEERIALRVRRSATRASTFPLRDHYENDRWMYGDAHKRLTDSGDWREHIVLTEHRYMTEDIHYGLAFLVSVADWAGVSMRRSPAACWRIAAAVCGRDLRAGPRTLDALGLAALDRAGMRACWRRARLMTLCVAALGAGRMGRGIAHAFAYAGHEVWLIDSQAARDAAAAQALEADARREIEASLRTLAELGVFDAALIPAMLARVHFAGARGGARGAGQGRCSFRRRAREARCQARGLRIRLRPSALRGAAGLHHLDHAVDRTGRLRHAPRNASSMRTGSTRPT
jgi:opine dehydrogenase